MKLRMRTTTEAIPQKVGQTFTLQHLMKKRPSLRKTLMRKEETFLLQPRLNRSSNQSPPLTQPPRPAARPVQPPRPPLPPQPPRCGCLKSTYHRPHLNQPRGPHTSTRPWNRRRQRKSWKSKRRKWREPRGQWGRKWKQNNTPVFRRVVAQRWYRLCCLPAWAESSRWGCKEAGPQEEKTDCTFSVAATTTLISALPLPALTLSKEILCLRIYNCESKTFGSPASPNLGRFNSLLSPSSQVHQITQIDYRPKERQWVTRQVRWGFAQSCENLIISLYHFIWSSWLSLSQSFCIRCSTHQKGFYLKKFSSLLPSSCFPTIVAKHFNRMLLYRKWFLHSTKKREFSQSVNHDDETSWSHYVSSSRADMACFHIWDREWHSGGSLWCWNDRRLRESTLNSGRWQVNGESGHL